MTGGGTAGHVTPNIALMPQLRAEGWNLHYAGTADGIERTLIEPIPDVTYHVITSGKLRRYFSLQNLTDPFRIVKGIFESRKLVKKIKPDVVFSKGGFVSVPVVIGAAGKAPIVIHESDYTPGLANRIAGRFASTICVTFEDTLAYTHKKGVHTGTPIRASLYEGSEQEGLKFAGFTGEKPMLLVMGGSQGAQAVNDAVRAALPGLLEKFNVLHLCGKGKLDGSIDRKGYRQIEYVTEEMPHVFAAADLIVSRAGANSVFEFLALSKPALLIPLPAKTSRGDQVLNASYFERKGYAMMLDQKDVTPASLLKAVGELYDKRLKFISSMSSEPLADGTDEVLEVIRRTARVYE
jgi:UDP-N-acetylglucosamine--N-acetylmuramyl-(pentapeptide) pyrophosphoryl-undecaprenol N-acetylglucosamine transferase